MTVQIIWDVRISEGQIIWAILYFILNFIHCKRLQLSQKDIEFQRELLWEHFSAEFWGNAEMTIDGVVFQGIQITKD